MIKRGTVQTIVLSLGTHAKIHHRKDGTFGVGFTDGAAGRAYTEKTYKTLRGALACVERVRADILAWRGTHG